MIPEYDELLVLAETLGEVKTKTEKLEAEFSTQARPLEAATNALSAALSGIKALQFHVLDNNLGALSARVEEMRKAVDEQVGVIALELKKADETNAAKAGQDAEALRSEIAALQAQLGTLGAQFSAQLERVEFSAKEEAKKLQLIPGPAGAAGASLNPRGTFVDGETYNRLDVVSWLGSSYIAAVDGVTEKPSKNSNQWQVLASRGSGGSGGAGDFGSLAGVAQINQGGTGQTTRAAGLNALLPSQTGNVQYMLLTDGAGTVSWGAQPVAGLPSQTSNGGKLLTTDGTNASWSGAVTVSGSNATVAGTLTVNGASTFNNTLTVSSNVGFIGKSGSGTGGNWRYISDDGTSRWLSGILGTPSETAFDIYDIVNGRSLLTLTAAGVVKVPQTTASTSTSTGALVVSGGVGVAGAIHSGNNIRATGNLYAGDSSVSTGAVSIQIGDSRTGSGFSHLDFIGDTTYTDYGLRILRGDSGANATSFITHRGTGALQFITEEAASILLRTASTTALTITSAQQVQVNATTASTSTSSGALVCSGGVGVAGAINAGGTAFVRGSSHVTRVRQDDAVIDFTNTAESAYATGKIIGNTIQLFGNNGTGLTIGTTGNATFAGNITTAAPAGGTAAAWKLGTVASVSPTSPNRTIEVDIGGTIYYIHAKTTNN
jgi:hypothetical protein